MKRGRGQPTAYKPEYAQKLIEYFSKPPHTDGEASDFPTLAGFACEIGVHRETLLNWTDNFPEFFDAYKKAKDFQERFITVNAMKGLVNPAFAIFAAKNLLQWRDKQPDEIRPIVNQHITVNSDKTQPMVEEFKNIIASYANERNVSH